MRINTIISSIYCMLETRILFVVVSILFKFLKNNQDSGTKRLKELIFWAINLGVITFFIFIIFEQLILQAIVTLILFIAVALMTGTHLKYGFKLQQREFLTSGLAFLLLTAVTGIAYILLEFSPQYSSDNYKWLLRLHTFASLYGWNICGLSVISRFDDFPIRLNSRLLICLHWITAIILAPIGHLHISISILATICYAAILAAVFFGKSAPAADGA